VFGLEHRNENYFIGEKCDDFKRSSESLQVGKKTNKTAL
jgi:hypothetical protein